ncbi:hypothetical protein AVEN_19874-1 [Araneus ventricosus]|uniref:Uncharacterized protein n=1 Tax=Araneus ventricosus TaxID=182803 RepID=A0A4Y2PH01_ARAVE|nr:hypothetical protein AVEN_19874-1 [Araneus ventricosus]
MHALSWTFTVRPLHTIWFSSHQNPSSMQISDENWTIVVEKFENQMSFVFHLAHSVIKLKYHLEGGERCSLTKAKTTLGGRGVWVRVSSGGGIHFLKAREGGGDLIDRWFGAIVNDLPK